MSDLIKYENIEILALSNFFKILLNKYNSIYELERYLSTLPQVPEELNHHFIGGVYIRELKIPKGSLIIGKRHKFSTCNILMKGKMALYSEETELVDIISGPFIFESKPLVKKMAYILEDCIFMNLHPTKKKDINEIEKDFIIPEQEYLSLIESGEIL